MENYNTISDKEIISLYLKQEDMAAFEEILCRYETKVYNLALRYTRNPEDAEEVTQDVFLTLYKKLKDFEGKSAFSSWLFRITVNAAFMHLRKKKKHTNNVSIDTLPDSAKDFYTKEQAETNLTPEDINNTKELRAILIAEIKTLPIEYRGVYVLRELKGLSNEETAQILAITTPAVKSRLHRARQMLKRKLKRKGCEMMLLAA